MTTRTTAIEKWGDPAPDWIVVLADEVDRTSLRDVAGRLSLGKSTINEVLRRKYKGRIANIEAAVRGAFMGDTVECPVLDEIAVDLCLVNQRLPFSTANPVRVALHRACPTCRFNRTNRAPSAAPSTAPKPEEK
jgi:hypothetical protein